MFNKVELPSEFLLLWINNNLLQEEEQAVVSSYYQSYIARFPKRIQYFYDKQVESVLKLLAKIDNPYVLEVGCGLGSESLFMSLKGANVLGIDIDDKRFNTAIARKNIMKEQLTRALNYNFKKISILELDERNHYFLLTTIILPKKKSSLII